MTYLKINKDHQRFRQIVKGKIRDDLRKFLTRGDQAKVTMVYRGREMAHTELGRRILDRLVGDLKDVSKVERSPSLEGRFMTMIIGPDRQAIKRAEREAAKKAKQAVAAQKTKST